MLNNSPRTGITFGAFDLCHAGHVIMFADCKRFCDYLIVGLQVDPSLERDTKNRPIQSLYERYVQLSAIKYVDPSPALGKLQPKHDPLGAVVMFHVPAAAEPPTPLM